MAPQLRPLLFLLLAAAPFRGAAGDIILLRNGNRIQGEVIEEDSRGITVRFFGGTLHLKARDVVSVERENRLQYLLEEGDTFLRRGDADLAVEAFRKACESDPLSESARKSLTSAKERRAEGLAAKGLYGASLSAWREILAEAPDRARAAAAIATLESTLKDGAVEEAAAARALEGGAVEDALARLRSLNERFPERRGAIGPLLARALLARGNGLLSASEPEKAEECYLEALSLEPDLLPEISPRFAGACAIRLAPLAAHGEFQKLLSGAEEGLQIAPANDTLLYLAAYAQDGMGRKREAEEGYRKVAGLPRGSGKSLELLRKAAEEKINVGLRGEPAGPDPARREVLSGNFQEIESEHFVILHRNVPIGNEVAEAAETAYKLLQGELSLKKDWRKRCTITVFPTQEEFLKSTGAGIWTGGTHQIQRKMGAFSDHRIYSYQTNPRLASAVIPHEVAHAMLAFALDYPAGIPLWFNEGFAIHWEPQFARRNYERILGRAAQSGALIPIAKLLSLADYPSQDESVKVFYAESYSLVDLFLAEKGLERLMKFARELAEDPASLNALLEKFYRIKGIRALESRWAARFSI